VTITFKLSRDRPLLPGDVLLALGSMPFSFG
jgi:hypothetical protein